MAMSPVLEKLLAPPSAPPKEQAAGQPDIAQEIAVIFTSIEATLSALREAGHLAGRLNARLALIVPQIVPYPLPLTSPPVSHEFNKKRFRVMAGDSRVETKVRICLCRDRDVALEAVLKPHSLVVIGGHGHWWHDPEKRLAHRLRRAGHKVVLAEA
jgi:hypothetical protein